MKYKVGSKVRINHTYPDVRYHNITGIVLSFSGRVYNVMVSESVHRDNIRIMYREELDLCRSYPNTKLYHRLYPNGELVNNMWEVV